MGGAGAFRDHCSESDEDGHLTGWVNPSTSVLTFYDWTGQLSRSVTVATGGGQERTETEGERSGR